MTRNKKPHPGIEIKRQLNSIEKAAPYPPASNPFLLWLLSTTDIISLEPLNARRRRWGWIQPHTRGEIRNKIVREKMRKYDPPWAYIAKQTIAPVKLTFAEIGQLPDHSFLP